MSPRTIILIAVLSAAAFGSWYLSRSNSSDDEGNLLALSDLSRGRISPYRILDL